MEWLVEEAMRGLKIDRVKSLVGDTGNNIQVYSVAWKQIRFENQRTDGYLIFFHQGDVQLEGCDILADKNLQNNFEKLRFATS